MRGKWLIGATCAALALAVAPAHAADPGRWKETGRNSVPLYYYQGVTSDPAKNLYFDGVHVGLYKTDSSLNELARHDDEIPAQVHVSEGYNHMGDLTWDPAEGGRLLLPLECYYPYPGAPNSGNTCGFGTNGQPEPGTGSFGVADPDTLDWRYYVKLDERDILKAMWAETSPDGKLVWTSSGKDLLAYRSADIKPQNAAPAGPKLRPVKRLVGYVPPTGITGAAFEGERLLVAGQDGGGPFQIWSIDLTTGARELQVEREIVGESEGIDTVDALGGRLHWLIQPYNEENVPTYGVTNGTLLNFVRTSQQPGGGGGGTPPPPCCTPDKQPPPGSEPRPAPTPPARIKLTISPRRVVARRPVRFRIRTTVTRNGRTRPVARASVHFAGRLFKTNRIGRARITARLRVTGRREGRASKSGLRKGHAWIWVRRR